MIDKPVQETTVYSRSQGRFATNSLGEWNWSDDDDVEFCSESIGFVRSKLPATFGRNKLTVFYVPGWPYGIGVEYGQIMIWHFSTLDGRIYEVAQFEGRRNLDTGLQFVKALANEKGMAIIYEAGVIFFDPYGRLSWRQDQLKLDTLFLGLTEDGAVFQGSNGDRLSFCLTDGARREV